MAQDDVRENQLVDLFNLERPKNRTRHGTDAILKIAGKTLEFELKSVTTTKGGLSTVRDLGRDHIEKWRNKHWIIAFYSASGLIRCKYVTPNGMSAWIEKIWSYIEPDFQIADCVPPLITLDAMAYVIGKKKIYSREDAKRLHKNQYSAQQYKDKMDLPNGYSPQRMLEIFSDRVTYLIQRGSTLNNPHIPIQFFEPFPTIEKNHAVKLRKLVRAWLRSKLR
jgi:hypothetical protein